MRKRWLLRGLRSLLGHTPGEFSADECCGCGLGRQQIADMGSISKNACNNDGQTQALADA